MNFLCPRQQAGLLGISRIKTHAVRAHRMALRHKQGFAGLQLIALCKSLVHIRRGIAAAQPLGQHGSQTGVMHLHFVGQRRQAAGSTAAPGYRACEERQFNGRQVLDKGLHHLQLGHFQRAQAVAQGGLDGVFPSGLHLDAGPQTLQVHQAVLAEPGLEFFIGAQALLQGFERF